MAKNPGKRLADEEKQLITQALEALAETAGVDAKLLKTGVHRPQGDADAEIRVAGRANLLVEVKRTLTPATVGQAVAQLARFGRPAALVTRYVTPQLAEQLKALDVGFMDTVGNAYLRRPDLLIYITGRKPPPAPPQERRVRALRPTGLKVIFALLCRVELLNAPYRQIAEAAGVALGTVGWVFDDLRRLGYLRETKARGRVYENRQGLIDKWVEGYAQQLRPRLKPRRYRVADPDWWKHEDLSALDMWLGGEPAAAVLTKHLRPEIVTVYGDTRFAALARKVRAAKDEYGNLDVLQKFWRFDVPPLHKRYPLVPPLLIYADLVATADARNIETAQLVRERFLDQG